MNKIMLVCNAGMSTSMLVKKMKDEAESQGIDVDIFAVPVSDINNNIDENLKVMLIGPQVMFLEKELKEKYEPKIKIEGINIRDYGTMNGKKVLERALQLIN